ncbi:MAG: multicopper oxidase domain-containing protein [Thermomicrobiales bacterium]
MVIETKPRRQRVPISDSTTDHPHLDPSFGNSNGDDGHGPSRSAVTTSPSQPPTQPGPSWVQFIAMQTTLLLGLGLLFGIIAIGVALNVPATTSTTEAAAVDSSAAVASVAPTPAATATPVPAAVTAARLPQPTVAPPVGSRAAQTVTVALEAREVTGLLAEGIGYTYWTFGGTVPGPMIRVRQGDTVELTLTNAAENKAAHSIDLQAVNGPGGGGDVTMVAPGQSKTFRFQALSAGVFVYQSGSDPLPQQVSSGMYGLIVVEPPQGLPKVDHEFYVMQGELYLDGKRDDHGQRSYSSEKALAGDPDYVVFNGSVDALNGEHALRAKTGETVRLFFGVAGPNQGSRLHISGEIFDRVALEGMPLADTTRWLTNVPGATVAVGGTAVIELKAEVPGRYSLIDSGLGHAQQGATGYLIIDGAENPGVFTPQH